MPNIFDIKYAVNRLIFDKGYSIVILLAMAIGLAVALFLFAQILPRTYFSLPFAGAKDFVYASRYENDVARTNGGLSNYEARIISEKQSTLDNLAVVEERLSTISTEAFTKQVAGVGTSSNIFKLVDVQPILGRVLMASDDEKNASPSVVISYDIWQQLYQKQNNVIGNVLKIDGVLTTIVGVMPQGFKFPLKHDFWVPYAIDESTTPDDGGWNSIVGKLKGGMSLSTADENFKHILDGIINEYPRQYSNKSIIVQPFAAAFAKPKQLLSTIMIVVAVSILLMSCFSVVSLIIVRMMESAKQAAIKGALGIPPTKIIISPVLESFILCFLAGTAGVLLCMIALNFASSYVVDSLDPFWWEVKMGWHIVICALLFSSIAWVFTGILPVYLAMRKPSLALLAGGRKGGGNKVGPVMNSFISLQVSCAFVLMVFASVCLTSLYKIARTDYGVNPQGYLTAQLKPSLYAELNDRVNYIERLQQQISSLPGVVGVAFTNALPGSYSYLSSYNGVDIDLSFNGSFLQTIEIPISDNIFEVLNKPLIEGRAFSLVDDESGEQVVIVSETIANKISPHSSAIGKKIQLNPDKNGEILTIVGVAADMLYGPPISFYEEKLDSLYRPIRQVWPGWSATTLVVKYEGDPYGIEDDLAKVARAVDPQVALTDLLSFEDRLSSNGNDFRALIYNFIPTAFLAFLMSALGIYAISARIILQRTNDIGIMKAIGISDRDINRIFMREIFRKLLLGIIVGVGVFIAFIPGIISKLVVIDYSVLVLNSIIVIIVLVSIVLVASYIPLLKAHKLSPQVAINN